MTTTDTPDHSGVAANVIPLSRDEGAGPRAVARAVARLLPRIEAGEGAAMVEAVAVARRWWDGYDAACAAMGAENAPHLTEGWNELQRAVACAPARDLAAVLAKARLADWQLRECCGDWAVWFPDMVETLRGGVERLASGDRA